MRSHRKVHLIGFSMGGLIALRLAARQPVDSLTLLATPITLAQRDLVEQQLGDRFPSGLPVGAAEQLLTLARVARRGLGRVTAPLLAVHGERDPWTGPSDWQLLYDQVASPVKEYQLLHGRGHYLPLEGRRDALFASLHQWMQRFHTAP